MVLFSLSFRSSYRVDSNDLTTSLLDLAHLHEEVPESRLGHDSVGSENSHAVELGGGLSFGGQMAPDHLVFVESP